MKNGFTLIEIMVAISIFAIVAVVATGALVTASDVNRKAQAIKLAIDNVNFAMDSMVLNLRDGVEYYCLSNPGGPLGSPSSYFSPTYYHPSACVGGGGGIVFLSRRAANPGDENERRIIYRFNVDPSGRGRIQIAYSDDSPPEYIDLTSPEVDIESLKFYIPSLGVTDKVERTVITVAGRVPGKTATDFFLQTSVKSNK